MTKPKLSDTWEVKDTPVSGVLELGKLTPNPRLGVRASFGYTQSYDTRVKDLLRFLDISHNAKSKHYSRPEENDQGRDEPAWHVDNGEEYETEDDDSLSIIPSDITTDMIICIAGTRGTLFLSDERPKVSGNWTEWRNGWAWEAEPWTVYWVRYDVIHASPLNCADEHRLMTRYYIDRDVLDSLMEE